ncbi:type II toxin-antitoxin system RelE/ParE family toxin [Candidatus Babeliales bacterium]|nr:type II toxin-antitoxin system RelE/ParE family toxin [Candidatus Babeliales bacterium]
MVVYKTKTGKSPFFTWKDKLELGTRAIIRTRLDRVSDGNLGDSKPIKGAQGIHELRINYGPGYRIYFGKKGNTVVILLIGGDKASQNRDIERAKQYWLEYKEKG